MKIERTGSLVMNVARWLTAAVLFFAVCDHSWALSPSLPPGSNFDLSHWYLQLPTSGGVLTGTAGSVDSLSTAQLVAGVTNDYFYTGPDGAMTFWVPNNGATTSGSTHPRSELREELISGSTSLNWTLHGTHILTATCVVSNVPSDTQKVCIGQMHEPNTKPDGSVSANNEHMIMFNLAGKTVYANVNPDGNNGNSSSVTFLSGSTSVALGKPINYTMSIVDGLLTIIVNNVTNSWGLFSGTNWNGNIFQNWDAASGNTLYFKAGAYNQTANTNLAGGAMVVFTALTRYHAANITNQPVSTGAMAGSNATFTVRASGNGILTYQWQFNGTNLYGRTGSSLTLAGVTTNNAGNYAVVVTDNTSSFSAVTSAVATLTVVSAPLITTQPQSQSAFVGSNVTFTAGASGGALTVQWRKNGSPISGAVSNTLTLTNVQATNAGSYTVTFTNAAGSVTSAPANLTVTGTSKETFSTAGTTSWICPPGISSVQVECWGGGGAGGSAVRESGSTTYYGGGGGGGAYARSGSVPVTPGNSYTIIVGAGGASTASPTPYGNPGGDSLFSYSGTTNILAKGGGGGQNTSVALVVSFGAGGAGGTNTASTGDTKYSGGSGKTSASTYSGGGGSSAGTNSAGTAATSNSGATAPAGGGNGGNGVSSSSGTGTAGSTPGGGGGGGKANSSTARVGGAGAAGKVLLTYTACAAAVATTPTGNGGGTGGLAVCSGTGITLAETPSAGVALTYAWKKVGSGTVLGTGSTLVIASPVNGDQYTCDVTAGCGGGASTSPAATLVVNAPPGVSLNKSTDTILSGGTETVTATLSGSASGGIWTSSGTGGFSSTNALTTTYTPSAADVAAGVVTLTFTTIGQAAPCAAAAATVVVTIHQTIIVNGLTPLNPVVECTGNVTFTVAATGTGTLGYQWSTNGSPVTGQTSTNFTLNNLHPQNPVTVTVTVTNANATVSSNSIVTVQDTIGPVITLIGDNPLSLPPDTSFTNPGATAIDACAGSVVVTAGGTVDTNTPGSYTVTYTADDGSGNTNSASRTVTVNATPPPQVVGLAVTNETFEFQFTGTPGASYLIQAKTNPAAPIWQTIGTNTVDSNGLSTFIDLDYSIYPGRFYRVVHP